VATKFVSGGLTFPPSVLPRGQSRVTGQQLHVTPVKKAWRRRRKGRSERMLGIRGTK